MKQSQDRICATPESDDVVGDTLSPKQERAIQAILSTSSQREAALAAGISETTLWRYQQDKEFCRRLAEVRNEAIKQTTLSIQSTTSDAVTVLHNLMMKEETPASARISAVRIFLEYSYRIDEMDKLRSHLDKLEEHIRATQEEEALDAALAQRGNSN